MTPDQRTMLFAMLARIVRVVRPANPDQYRSDLTASVFGGTRSWSTFKDAEVDRMKVALQRQIDDLNLDAIIEDEQYHAHDGAQAAHVPLVRPGKVAQRKAEQRKEQPRRYVSRYERETEVDDPGRRRRVSYWIGRLFAPAYVARVAGDLFGGGDWESLAMPNLLLLKDTLKNRLGKWITKHKEKHDFGFPKESRNPRSKTGLLTNEELIAELLSRGICLDISEKEPLPEDCPF